MTHLNDPMTKPILEFLNYILPLVNRLNRKFQSEFSEYVIIYEEMKSLYLLLLNNLCGDKYIGNLKTIIATDFEDHILPRQKIYVGLAAEESIASGGMDEVRKKIFRDICCSFYVELFKQVRKRFNFNDSTLKMSAMMNPLTLERLPDLSQVLQGFPSFYAEKNRQELENKIRDLKMKLICKEVKIDASLGTEECWTKLLNVVRANGKLAFPLLRLFVSNFLIIPHSSAAVERFFSQHNLNKTKVRNRLSTGMLDAILQAKSYIKNVGGSVSIRLNKDIMSKFSKSIYKHHNKMD